MQYNVLWQTRIIALHVKRNLDETHTCFFDLHTLYYVCFIHTHTHAIDCNFDAFIVSTNTLIPVIILALETISITPVIYFPFQRSKKEMDGTSQSSTFRDQNDLHP